MLEVIVPGTESKPVLGYKHYRIFQGGAGEAVKFSKQPTTTSSRSTPIHVVLIHSQWNFR
jgi:hypothetical protein